MTFKLGHGQNQVKVKVKVKGQGLYRLLSQTRNDSQVNIWSKFEASFTSMPHPSSRDSQVKIKAKVKVKVKAKANDS